MNIYKYMRDGREGWSLFPLVCLRHYPLYCFLIFTGLWWYDTLFHILFNYFFSSWLSCYYRSGMPQREEKRLHPYSIYQDFYLAEHNSGNGM